LYAYLKFTLK